MDIVARDTDPDAAGTEPSEGPRRRFRTPLLAALALVAVCGGAAAGTVLAARSGPWLPALLAGVMSLVWAGVRWWLMRVTAREETTADAVTRAWAFGSLVYVFGVTPETRLAAWVVSAFVTAIVLARSGTKRSSAIRSVAIAWGAQAVVVVLSWLAEGAVLAYMALTS